MALVVVGLAPALVLTYPAFAGAPQVSIPIGPFQNGQNIAVSGSGFPTHAQDPTGVQIIQCSDPHGSPANLPTDASLGCEGITVNPGQINTDSAGRFHASFPIAALSTGAGTSSIDCDATHECVLWVGIDYNNGFLSGPHAFTAPFSVTTTAVTSTSTVPATPSGTTPTVSGSAPTGSSTGAATTNAATTNAANGGSLASTGLPGLVLWLFGLGVAMALVGLGGRRLTVDRSGSRE